VHFLVKKSRLVGEIQIPPSKSHTIRAAVIAALAEGTSIIKAPLVSDDTKACFRALRQMGAEISEHPDHWIVKGFNGVPKAPENVINIDNSGTSLRLLTSVAALAEGTIELDGDESIRKRPIQPLLQCLNDLGASQAESLKGNGCAPIVVKGRMKGGVTFVEATTSQYLSSILIAAPLLQETSDITATILNERPYVDITIFWLQQQGIEVEEKAGNRFIVPGGQRYHSFDKAVPADFSSATFPLVAALITDGSDVLIKGLDMSDPQGDKKIFDMVQQMGAKVSIEEEGIRVQSSSLKGIEIDLNEMPDALPAMAVLGCFAKGETRLVNTPQARIKETDRIKVMHDELKKMGADIEELEDGLIIRESQLTGTLVEGHHDHRIVMALSLAGMNATGQTEVTTAKSVAVTFPTFFTGMRNLGADLERRS